MSQGMTQTGTDSVTRSSWYEMADSTVCFKSGHRSARARKSRFRLEQGIQLPLMPDLQSAQPFNQTKRKRQQDGFIDRGNIIQLNLNTLGV